MSSNRAANRISIVTGGTGGLGRAVVRRLLERGDTVHVPWVARGEIELLQQALGDAPAEQQARLHLVEGSVTDEGWLTSFAQHLGESGGIDVLINLVGGFAMAPIGQLQSSQWDHMMELNARSVYLTCRAFSALLSASPRGAIANVASAPAVHGEGAGMSAYTASKGAVVSFTRALARELKPHGVTVNAVAPTTIDTEANREAMPDADRSGWITPDELAALFDYLTSDEARRITGNVVVAGL